MKRLLNKKRCTAPPGASEQMDAGACAGHADGINFAGAREQLRSAGMRHFYSGKTRHC